jgi:hypothetical protein
LQAFPCTPLMCEGAFEVALPDGLTSFLRFERLLNQVLNPYPARCRYVLFECLNFRSRVVREEKQYMQYQFRQPRTVPGEDRDRADFLRFCVD